MEDEDNALCRFGTLLQPLEEDDVLSKKPVAIENQIVTDENGRRRFHGAFTGGFSAGYWNTVGSLEGWKPQSFKSSRNEKAEQRQQVLPIDFMDEEDLGDFGIAPQRIQAKEDFAKTKENYSLKKNFKPNERNLISGFSTLQKLLEPSREKVAARLLRRMGWKPGQGIGARQTRKEKTRQKQQNQREIYVKRMYGCDTESSDNFKDLTELQTDQLLNSSDENEEIDLTFAPDDFETIVCSFKDNVFGFGYSGLDRQTLTSHINLFDSFEKADKNPTLAIKGQAFGVGAFEEDDEDIYSKDDMSKYDFSLADKKRTIKPKLPSTQSLTVLDGFADETQDSGANKKVMIVEIKPDFEPRNFLVYKSRFEPLPEEKLKLLNKIEVFQKRGLGRHDLDPSKRGDILNLEKQSKANKGTEGTVVSGTESIQKEKFTDKYKDAKSTHILKQNSYRVDDFTKNTADIQNESQNIIEKAKQITKSLNDTTCKTFKPFMNNEAKQKRYEVFLNSNKTQEDDLRIFLATIQPIHFSEWEKEMELKEFIQARNIFKPLIGQMSERFVSKFSLDVTEKPAPKELNEKQNISIERKKMVWKPCSLLCIRLNVPEPYSGVLDEPKAKKTKLSVFDYIESSVNSKKDFITPVIIPKHIEKPLKLINEEDNLKNLGQKINENLSHNLFNESIEPQTTNSSSQVMPAKKIKKKTELELKVEMSKNKHPSEKKDLFKSIFDESDSEALSDEENKATSNITLEAPNVLTNNSPPRGIFAALFSKPKHEKDPSNVEKITYIPKVAKNTEENYNKTDVYGPRIPTKSINQISNNKTESNEIDKRLIELLSTKSAKSSKVVEKWVEKTSLPQKKHKKEKHKKSKKSKKHKTKK